MQDELQQVGRTYVIWKNRRLSYFAGCDYFRIASHPAILRAVREGLAKYGLNVAASRLTTGNHVLYTRLEAALADFFGAPAAVLAGNGYATNLIAAQALDEGASHVFIDARAHASLRDAARFFPRPVVEFKHRDAGDLGRRLRGKRRPVVLTDGVFSHNGEIAPLREYLKVLPPGGIILLDDAHSAGILGARGRGTPEHAGVSRRRIVQTVTLSKAFGVYGGAILCEQALRERILAVSRMFAGNTPLPLPLANGALASIGLLRSDDKFRTRLAHNVEYVKSALRGTEMAAAETPAPIIAVIPRNARETKLLRKRLLSNGIFPSFIRYPGGPETGYFRFVISSEHSRLQLDKLLESLHGH
ncbi:MAG TPA: pyridoxal phosphate-dependent aminotransferase family protein [Verrucomicrobiae bacterium]|jgi:7-keto-8-aminopelargonate synthetase-like enzyme|nr:pyridoxal phosphate-dependent aminotransferase family protein [Verrucomicrobiae bacterium]